MYSFVNIFGGSAENTDENISEGNISVEDNKETDVDNLVDGNQISSVIETGTNWIKQHPVFVIWGVVAIAGLVYLAYFRNTNPDEAAAEESLLGKNTDELMDDLKLDLNLTKNVKEEHLSLSSDEDEDEDEDESQGNKENERIGELSNDLKELEEYTQESMDI